MNINKDIRSHSSKNINHVPKRVIMLVIIDTKSQWYGHSAVVKSLVNNRYVVDVLEVNNDILAQEIFRPDQVITATEYRQLQISMDKGYVSYPHGYKELSI